MEKIFWQDPYLHTLQTTVTAVDGNVILPASTIAFSFAGGQESDTATFNGLPVLGSERKENLILYTLPDGHGLNVGETITMIIDWPRRNRLMRLHFAAELILEIVTKKWHLEKVGARIAEGKSRIDFLCQENIGSHFNEILAAYNAIIAANHPIEKGFSDVALQRRYWKIDGFAQVPCGGTHVNTTGEVGYVTLKRNRPGKGIERIEIRLVDPSTPPPK